MKHLILSTALVSLGLLTTTQASAQNYLPPSTYSGANVIVNMDVLSNPAPAPMGAPTPLTRRPSPGLRSASEAAANVPLRLRRPSAPYNHVSRAPAVAPTPAPMMRAPVAPQHPPIVLKRPEPLRQQITSAPLQPLTPPADPTVVTRAPQPITPQFAEKVTAPTPATPEFSAKELVAAAQADAPQQPTPVVKAPTAPIIATPVAPAVPKQTDATSRQRELLAKAREEVIYDQAPKQDVAAVKDIAPSAAKAMPAPTAQNTFVAPPPPLPPATQEPMQMAALAQPQKPAVAKPAPVVKPAPAETVAAMDINEDDGFRFLFGENSADLATNDVALLDQIAARLTNKQGTKIQLRAFADGTPETSSKARRLSLTRALTVRSYLLDKGVSATAMDVRALGLGTPDSAAPADRVDIVFIR